jgi:hypothetical protein
MNSVIIGEDESFSLTANVTSPGYQRVALTGYLVKRTNNGTYVAPLIPQLFYGADGTQLSTWRQNFTTTGSQVILSRAAGGYPEVPDEELFWSKISDRRLGQPRTEAERAARHYEQYGTTEVPPRGTGLGLQAPKLELPEWVLPVVLGFGAAALAIGVAYYVVKKR